VRRKARWVLALAAVLALATGCTPTSGSIAKEPPPPGWSAVYFHYLAIDLDRKPIEGAPVDIVMDVVTAAPAQFYDADTGRLRDYPASVSKTTPYVLPFWFDGAAHGSISATGYYDSAPGDTFICYVSNDKGVEYPQTRSEKKNNNSISLQIQNPCYYNF
jgi:hypothetical protein